MKYRILTRTALFAALTAAGAFLRIPLPFGAVSLQFFITALAGLVLTPTEAVLSQAVYLLLGLLGLPVFAGGGGIGYLFQPTFGYLLGLIPAVWLISRQKIHPLRGCLTGLAALYAVGLPYFALILSVHLEQKLSPAALIVGGMLIYLPADGLKIAAAVWLSGKIRRHLFR